jgi:hypothetical protein
MEKYKMFQTTNQLKSGKPMVFQVKKHHTVAAKHQLRAKIVEPCQITGITQLLGGLDGR